MAEKFVNNPQYAVERFAWLQEQLANIIHNLILVMVDLTNMLRLFEVYQDSKTYFQSKGILGSWEEIKGPRKELEKYQPSSSAMNNSQSLFKIKVKVNIKTYQGEIDCMKLNFWLK